MTQLLIIDDEPTVQLFLQRILTSSGYAVAIAKNGKEGFEMAQEIRPDLIICDWLMPEMSGLEVCRLVKQLPQLSTTFFILLTSLVSVGDRVQGLDAGADEFLLKPIQPSELLARVRAGLRLHSLSQDLKEQSQRLEAELAEAADYVRSLLPEPLNHLNLSIDACFIPSRQLGGDGLDYFWLDEDNLAIYLLDVAGHGLRAALPSLSVINLLRSQKLNQVDYHSPRSVLSELNHVFQVTTKNDKYFTIWYGVYNCKTSKLTYGSAGHPAAILFQNTNLTDSEELSLKTQGFPIGLFEENSYQEKQIILKLPASLYIFSDGIYEIEKNQGLFWGLEDFLPLLRQYQSSQPHQLDELLNQLHRAYHKSAFEDDLSIIQVDFS